MMRFLLTAPILALALSACATPASKPRPGDQSGLVYARLGETVTVDGPQVTPLEVIEDSRCPQGVQCVWAGRVVIRARIVWASGAQRHEVRMTSGEPVAAADGAMTLVDVQPAKSAKAIAPRDYRFGFNFAGGL